jgi:hypothetical protein
MDWLDEPKLQDLQCPARTCLVTRHAAPGRNRGRSNIRVTLDGDVKGDTRPKAPRLALGPKYERIS